MLRDRRGVTALEFGIVGPIFLILLIGTIEVVRFIATWSLFRSHRLAETALGICFCEHLHPIR